MNAFMCGPIFSIEYLLTRDEIVRPRSPYNARYYIIKIAGNIKPVEIIMTKRPFPCEKYVFLLGNAILNYFNYFSLRNASK